MIRFSASHFFHYIVYGEKENYVKKIRLRSLTFTTKKLNVFLNLVTPYEIWTPPREYSYYISREYNDGTFFVFGNNDDFFLQCAEPEDDFISTQKPIKRLSDFELYDQYINFDFDITFPARYAVIHNELIERGLLHAYSKDVNDFHANFNSYFTYSDKEPKNFSSVRFTQPTFTTEINQPKTKIRNMSNESLIREFNDADFFEDETRYALLSYEINKRNLL